MPVPSILFYAGQNSFILMYTSFLMSLNFSQPLGIGCSLSFLKNGELEMSWVLPRGRLGSRGDGCLSVELSKLAGFIPAELDVGRNWGAGVRL